jgi:histone acetyltransferase 1
VFCFLFQKQARRIYEILRLRATNVNNPEEFTKYRLDIKRRLNAPFAVRFEDFDPRNWAVILITRLL